MDLRHDFLEVVGFFVLFWVLGWVFLCPGNDDSQTLWSDTGLTRIKKYIVSSSSLGLSNGAGKKKSK